MAGLIKQYYPNSKIFFLGRTYTKDVVNLSEHITEFLNYDEIEKLSFEKQKELIKNTKANLFIHVFPNKAIAKLAKAAKINTRIGTKSRIYHWFTCNKLITLKRKKSFLHEAQLNFKLLEPLSISSNISIADITNYYGFTNLPKPSEKIIGLIDYSKTNIVLHPKSKGSAREWGLDNFMLLAKQLDKNMYKVFVSGIKQDTEQVKALINMPNVVDITGRLSLQEFIAFINSADVLIAASTGPLHIAAALNKKAIGLFAPMRPIFPTRWAPIGKHAKVIVENKNCNSCAKSIDCACIKNIKVNQVIKAITESE